MNRAKELTAYIFWGAVTTLVNYAVYFVCTKLFVIHYLLSNLIAWFLSVLFAYIVNKVFVFASKDWSGKRLFKEIWQFMAARVFSGAAETGMLWVLVDIMGYQDTIIKITAGMFVIVVNYVFSKWIIFRD